MPGWRSYPDEVPLPDSLATPDPESLTLLLVRHGRTRFNAERRIQGWADSELTPDGLAGVRATAADLSRVALDAAYSSPSQRTLTTSSEILEHHPALEVVPRDGLREFNFGEFEERSEAELVDHIDWIELFRGVLDGTYPGFPGGESARTYLDRVEAGIRGDRDRARTGRERPRGQPRHDPHGLPGDVRVPDAPAAGERERHRACGWTVPVRGGRS